MNNEIRDITDLIFIHSYFHELDLPAIDKIIIMHLRRRINKEGYSICSLEDFAYYCNISVSSAQKKLNKLNKLKIIKIEKTGRASKYSFFPVKEWRISKKIPRKKSTSNKENFDFEAGDLVFEDTGEENKIININNTGEVKEDTREVKFTTQNGKIYHSDTQNLPFRYVNNDIESGKIYHSDTQNLPLREVKFTNIVYPLQVTTYLVPPYLPSEGKVEEAPYPNELLLGLGTFFSFDTPSGGGGISYGPFPDKNIVWSDYDKLLNFILDLSKQIDLTLTQSKEVLKLGIENNSLLEGCSESFARKWISFYIFWGQWFDKHSEIIKFPRKRLKQELWFKRNLNPVDALIAAHMEQWMDMSSVSLKARSNLLKFFIDDNLAIHDIFNVLFNFPGDITFEDPVKGLVERNILDVPFSTIVNKWVAVTDSAKRKSLLSGHSPEETENVTYHHAPSAMNQ